MLKKEKTMGVGGAGGWKLFEFEFQDKFKLFCLLGNISIFCSFWRAVLNKNIWYLGKIRKLHFFYFLFRHI